MGTLERFLKRHQHFGADTMVFIYHFEDHPTYAVLTQLIFESWETGRNIGVTSAITVMEILVKPKREGKLAIAREYWELLTTFPNLHIVSIDLALVDRASDLRAKYGLRTPDALQVAAVLSAGATGFITNDERLKDLKELEVLLLSECTRKGEPR